MNGRRVTDQEIVTVVRYLESVDTCKIFKDADTKQWFVVGIVALGNAPGQVFTVGSFDEAFIAAADVVRTNKKALADETG